MDWFFLLEILLGRDGRLFVVQSFWNLKSVLKSHVLLWSRREWAGSGTSWPPSTRPAPVPILGRWYSCLSCLLLPACFSNFFCFINFRKIAPSYTLDRHLHNSITQKIPWPSRSDVSSSSSCRQLVVVQRHKVPRLKVHWQNVSRDKTSQGTKHPKDKTFLETKRPKEQSVRHKLQSFQQQILC